MNKKILSSLLLVSMLTSCDLNLQNTSSSSSNKVSGNLSSSSSSSTNVITSSSSSSDNWVDDWVSSPFVPGEYISSTNVDKEKYPYIDSIGVKRGEAHNAYQILVYSFYDSDGDGYGDLKGVEQKLDYIKGLGSDIIWLSPIMPAESYHAYDVVSFFDIDEKIGTLEDYISLVNAAHSKNMKIVLDMPINHTSVNHEWFRGFLNGEERYADFYQEKKAGVINGTTSSMGSTATFYVNRDHKKTYFAAFGATMPDLNFQSENVVEAIKDVFEYWVRLGADGFRFDAVKHIFDPNEIPQVLVDGEDKTWDKSVEMNNALFKELGNHLKTISPDLYLLGENFSGQGEVKLYAESFDAEFDFDAWHTSLGAVTNKDPWNQSERRKYYDDTIVGNSNELISLNPNWIPTFMTGNHDVNRAASWIGEKVRDDDKALKLYASMLTLRSGIPFIYYGDELGMTGWNKSGDGFVEDAEIRMPMQFEDSTIDVREMFYSRMPDGKGGTVPLGLNVMKDLPNYKKENPTVEASIADENSLYNAYKNLIAFRNSQPAIYNGTMAQTFDFTGGTMISMTDGKETVYVAHNFQERSIDLADLTDGSLELLYEVNGSSVSGTTLKLASRGTAVLKITGTVNLTPTETLGEFDNSGENSGEAPATGFALYVTPGNGKNAYYIPLNPVDEFEGFQQHMADNVTFAEGDTFILYDCDNSVGWVEDTLNPYSVEGCFEVVSEGIRCVVGGTYDIYVKFKWEADEVYIGPAEG